MLSNGELQGYDGALCAFYDEIRFNWKLALVTIDFNITSNGIKVEFQPAKRFSFLVGEGEPSKTYIGQLTPLYEMVEPPTYELIKDAFSISRVTKDFYNDYCDCFEKISKYLITCRSFIDESIRLQYDDVKKFAITFTKKTLGQIVFLHFIQKKGWLGVKTGQNWGTGDKNFIYKSTINYRGNNYFNDVLEPLFYEALNKKRLGDLYNGEKIPFLNGGLFSPVENYKWKETNFNIPDEIWFNDKKTGFLDILNQYNFTVDESDPTEQDIAVDPEMLGKIFESLLDPDERHDNGAHYTPREIVHFMCIESLAYNISDKFNIDFSTVKNYIIYGNALENKQIISDNAMEISLYLKTIRIVDPAVGSGAFLVGMLNEILKLRINLSELSNVPYSKYEIKKDAIQNSLFGVDIEYDAIEIAKLRLWLSLIVDQEVEENSCPNPLPNLAFQLRVGNSLVDEYHGVKLWDDSLFKKKIKKSQYSVYNIFNVLDYYTIIKNLKKAKEAFFTITDEKDKNRLFNEISKYQLELIKNVLYYKDEMDVFDEVEEMIKKRTKPFFLWKLEFDKVFDEGGFDIVIANPPYIQLQNNGGKLANELESQGFKTFSRMGDIYCLFYEQAINLLKKNGTFAFITSNKWMRAGYGEKLRGFLAEYTNPRLLLDFGGTKIFESATVDVNILIASNSKNNHYTKTVNFADNGTENLSVYIEQFMSYNSYENNNIWTINSKIENSIKSKIESRGKKLSEWDIKILYGVKTGFNDAFIIDELTRNKLITVNQKNDEIIRPIIRGRDIKQYSYNPPNLYLINFPCGFTNKICFSNNKENEMRTLYPEIFNHFDKFKNNKSSKSKGLLKRDDQGDYWWELRSCVYMDVFNGQVIAWQRITQKNTFCITKPGTVVLDSMAFLSDTKDKTNYLLGFLNSSLVYYWMRKNVHEYGASGFRLSNQYVKEIIVPTDKVLINTIDTIMKNNHDLQFIHSQIDKILFNYYNFTSDEINEILNII